MRNLRPFAVMAFLFTIALASRAQAFSFTPYGVGTLPDGKVAEAYQVTFDPGETFPWHFHLSDLYGVITQGTLTEYQGCNTPPVTHNAGDAIHEQPGEVHMVANNGTEQVVIQFFGVMPSCDGGFADTVITSGPPRCDCGHPVFDRVPTCAQQARNCTLTPDGVWICKGL
jgi:quercetin dioxygenase-like cupin family protein